ncbi:MAG: phosphopentomutase [Ignavibacteriaceae bacterium]
MNNFFLIVLDGVGVGELPDASMYGDSGSNTLANIANAIEGFSLPNLQRLGTGNIIPITGVPPTDSPLASFGKMQERSKGKDSTTGHWELGGLHINFDFSYFPDGFPEDIMDNFLRMNNLKGYLGNIAASGTEIIKELGEEHVRTGFPIVYTSADSVFQIASHEDVIPLKELYKICSVTREKVLVDPYVVGRVIARPFKGSTSNFTRTTNRHDYSLAPPANTILDVLKKNGISTVAIGKINDLFNHRGISIAETTKSNTEGCNKLLEYSSKVTNSLIFANLVDFDVYYGHRNDPDGFYKALKDFDTFLPSLLEQLDETDHLVLTADHGNDPTSTSTDHSREYIPLLYFRKNKKGMSLGIRETFSDTAVTIAEHFKVKHGFEGKSFYI